MATLQVKKNAGSLATRQRQRGKAVDAAMKARARLWGETVKQNAVSLSQGTISAAALRRYSPGLYSRARAANPGFDAVLNRQTGLLAASWRMQVWAMSDKTTVTVFNTAPYSGFMLGTVKMRPRPILDFARGQVKPFSRQVLDAKRQGERCPAGSLLFDLVQVGVTVTFAYGGAAAP